MKDEINRLVKKPAAEIKLAEPATPDAIREKTGLEREKAGKVKGEQVTAESTDGLFTFVVQVAKT